jgi:eukaryotic-like serine/threonine-protein kinase
MVTKRMASAPLECHPRLRRREKAGIAAPRRAKGASLRAPAGIIFPCANPFQFAYIGWAKMKICRVCQSQYPDDQSVCAKDGTDLHSATDIKAGTVLGSKYEILAKVGEGGMGAVFKAKSVADGHIWALKVVAQRLLEEPGFRQRFKSEALIMQALDHPNDVRVIDYAETQDGLPFTVMEFVDGPHLDELVPAGTKMDIARAVNLVIQLVDGLGAAHKMTIIHRDVKPDNIMVAKTGGVEVAKLLDFGVAKVKEAGELFASQKTAAGVMIGTPAYMSPEQVKGVPSDQLTGAVDLYAAAVILFELLCGRPPFVEKKPVMMLMAHAATPPPDPRQYRKELCPALSAAILKALQKDPTQRFADAAEMHAALEAGLKEQLSAAPAAAAAAAPAAPAPPAARPAVQAPPPVAAAPPPRPPARDPASDPEATAQRLVARVPEAPPQPPAIVASHYAGKMPKAHGVVQYSQKKRHWGRVIFVVLLLVALLAGAIWFFAPRIRKLSLSSKRQAPQGTAIVSLHKGRAAGTVPGLSHSTLS